MTAFDLDIIDEADEIAGVGEVAIHRPIVIVIEEDIDDPHTGGDIVEFVGKCCGMGGEVSFGEFANEGGFLALWWREGGAAVEEEVDGAFGIARGRIACATSGVACAIFTASDGALDGAFLNDLAGSV